MDIYWDMLGKTVPRDTFEQYTSFKLAEQRLSKTRVLDVLDLGCGDGRAVDFFYRINPNARYTGVDIEASPEVLTRTRNDAKFDTFDGINLPYDTSRFDVVFSHQVFEHVAQPYELLKSVARVLKPEGVFIGSVSQLEPYHSFSLWNFTTYGWCKLNKAAGLDVVELRPGIDSLALICRSVSGRKPKYSRYFSSESPLNKRFEREGKARGMSVKQIAHRKLIYSGHIIFLTKKATSQKRG